MHKLSEEIIRFFQHQNFVIVASLDINSMPHCSCKGLVKISPEGRCYILDLYSGRTHENIIRNPQVSITAVDEHKFKGYCLKGTARVLTVKDVGPEIMKLWEEKVADRLTKRLLKNIKEEKGHPAHPESRFPKPEYMFVVEIKEIVNLTPYNLR